MLRYIEANGFKSLIDFKLELEPGINVLVGPNGAGKTNILKLLEFLSELTRGSISQAVSNCGGAGELFYRSTDKSLWREISFKICGETRAPYFYRPNRDEDYSLLYDYSASIRLADNSVYFEQQSFSLYIGVSKRSDRPTLRCEWDYNTLEGNPIATLTTGNVRELEKFTRFDKDDRRQLERMLLINDIISENCLLKHVGYVNPIFRVVINDIQSGKAYNINPSRVREPEDIAKAPGVSFDGSGLASTLLALKKSSVSQERETSIPFYYVESYSLFDASFYAQVQDYCRLVSDDILSIDADSDFIENKSRVFVSFVRGEEAVILPISYVSDGTAKWLALMTAMVTSQSAFCIEEPENFLHPKLQQEIITISRAISEQAIRPRFVLMTTHSETLLNSLKPHEVIVTSRVEGKTRCHRPNNADTISSLINKTGFGLGHFYLTGSIE